MIPLHDDNPTELKPTVTVALIVLCGLVFLGQVGLAEFESRRFVFEYGFIPALLFIDARPSGWTPPLPCSDSGSCCNSSPRPWPVPRPEAGLLTGPTLGASWPGRC